jgi:hypothetical protein
MDPTSAQLLALRDIHLPAAPPWWPPAPGWWALALLLVVLLVIAAWWLWRAVQRRRRWRQLLAHLNDLESKLQREPAPHYLAGLSALLRRLALVRYPRREVAPLNGEDWLAFLDRTGGDGAFQAGAGRVIGDAVYRKNPLGEIDVAGLMRAVRVWVWQNAGGRA